MYDTEISTNYYTRSVSYGGRLGISFDDFFSVGIEGHIMNCGQNYSVNGGGPKNDIDYYKEVTFDSYDFGFSARYLFPNNLYLEGGMKFSGLTAVKVTNTFEPGEEIDTLSNPALKFEELQLKDYTKSLVHLTAGIGLQVIDVLDSRLTVKLGVRFAYSLGDFMLNRNLTPLHDGIYNKHNMFNSKYGQPMQTHMFTGQAVVEVSYFFAYYGKSGCGKKRIVFFK